MNFTNKILLVAASLLACQLYYSLADDAVPAVKRIALRRPTNAGKGLKAGGPSTTTTTEAPLSPVGGEGEEDYQEGEGAPPQYADGEENLDEQVSSTTTTTTETPKRIGPVIRPFRSNDDFLNSLKRRQMNAKKNKLEKGVVSKPGKSVQDSQETAETAPVPAPSSNSKTFSKSNSSGSRRKFNKASKTAAEEETANDKTDAEQKEDQKPKRTTSRLPSRKRNNN